MGSSYRETVAFRNDGYSYEVLTRIQRGPEGTGPREGGVRVMQGQVTVAELTCDLGMPSSMDMLYDLKDGIGQCRDLETQTWGLCN